MLNVKVALLMSVHCAAEYAICSVIFKALEYCSTCPYPCQQHTLCWDSDVFASPSCCVVKSMILFPLTSGLVTFIFLASTYNWFGHVLRKKCLLKLDIEGKIERTKRRGRRRKHLLDDFKETRR